MPVTGARAAASKRVRDAIVAATVRLVAREGVASVTHRRVAAEAGVSLSSTTWHFATKADILKAALHWTAATEVASIEAIAERLAGTPFDGAAWADELADWLERQITDERDAAVALYRLQIELLGAAGTPALHRDWGESLRTLGDRVLGQAATDSPELDIRLVIAALDGLRLGVLLAETGAECLRPAVHRQLQALFGSRHAQASTR